jgi:hypothetical protein
MASCENCKKTGIPAEQISVGFMQGTNEQILLGPCCNGTEAKPQVNYHFELSSEKGFIANVEYNGLSFQYRKTPDELRRAFKPAAQQPLQDEPTQYQH